MPNTTHISIIQLIKSGKISVTHEISKIRAGKDINIYIRTYLEKSDHYRAIQQHIGEATTAFQQAQNLADQLHFDEKRQQIYQIEKDFICNTLYLADTLSKIDPRTERLKKAIQLFEEAKISEADAVLAEADLLNDQFALLAFVEYQKNKIQTLTNGHNLPPN